MDESRQGNAGAEWKLTEEMDREMTKALDAEMKQWDDEVRALGHPEWCVAAFQMLRRLVERIDDPKRAPNIPEVRQDILNALQRFPPEIAAYDEKMKKEVDLALEEFRSVLERNGLLGFHE